MKITIESYWDLDDDSYKTKYIAVVPDDIDGNEFIDHLKRLPDVMGYHHVNSLKHLVEVGKDSAKQLKEFNTK